MYDASLSSSVYFELDIIGNVRRLRGGKALSTSAPLASDLGGYRYTAFGHLNTTDTATAYPTAAGNRYDQPLRWQSRWFIDAGSGFYDFRARVWSPELAAFLQPDEYGFLTRRGTLWSWPGQNPFRYRDPSGRDAVSQFFQCGVEAAACAAECLDALAFHGGFDCGQCMAGVAGDCGPLLPDPPPRHVCQPPEACAVDPSGPPPQPPCTGTPNECDPFAPSRSCMPESP